MEFNVNHPMLFVMVGIVITAILTQSLYFLIRALRRAAEIKISKQILKSTVVSAVLFTIAPAVAILVGVVALSKSLGIAIPWLRLSVIGSLSYETIAAETTLKSLGLGTENEISDPNAFVTVLWVMTLGIILGLILTPLLIKKIQGGIKKIEKMDKKWSEIFNNAMFIGMISAFLGFVFCDFYNPKTNEIIESGFIPILVMLVSAVAMVICGVLTKVLKQRWITDYALPISLVAGMVSAIPITNWLH